jgi:hypothetical protein
MQHERRDYDDDNLAEVWRSAQHRRSDDIYFWFTHFLETRPQLKSSGGRDAFPLSERPLRTRAPSPCCSYSEATDLRHSHADPSDHTSRNQRRGDLI